MAKTLALNVDKDKRPERGTWWSVRYPNGHRMVLWCCPICGQTSALKTHKIHADGEVTPSVVCEGATGTPCTFHDYITLDEVQPEVVNA